MEEDIKKIKERNKRVESDKAWEVSITRRFTIAAITYFIVVIFLQQINAPKPWLNALVPTAGYILSTLTVPILKKMWIKRVY